MKNLLVLFLIALVPLSAQEKAAPVDLDQLKHPVHPALFKIEGKELTKPSYLFGTIHLADPRVTNLHPEAEEAFQSADRFYSEVDLAPAKMLAVTAMMMRQDGKTLSKSIGPELTKELDAALKEINPALSSKPFDPMKTWVMTAQLPLLEFQLAGKQALDAVLFQRAQKAGKKSTGLETIESQLKIFDDLKEEEQILMLGHTVRSMAEEKEKGENSLQKMLDLYLTGTVPELGAFLKESMVMEDDGDKKIKELNDRFLKKLLDDRNGKMARTISEALAKQPGDVHFFAVGAAHYVGPTAIQKFLTKEGYTVTPLFK